MQNSSAVIIGIVRNLVLLGLQESMVSIMAYRTLPVMEHHFEDELLQLK